MLPHWAQVILDFLNTPSVKFAATLIGTFILRRNERIVNQAIAFWGVLGSVVASIIGTLFPGHAHETTTTLIVGSPFMLCSLQAAAAATHGSWLGSLLHAIFFNGILPWASGYGVQRGGDHAVSFVRGPVLGSEGPTKPQPLEPFTTIVK